MLAFLKYLVLAMFVVQGVSGCEFQDPAVCNSCVSSPDECAGIILSYCEANSWEDPQCNQVGVPCPFASEASSGTSSPCEEPVCVGNSGELDEEACVQHIYNYCSSQMFLNQELGTPIDPPCLDIPMPTPPQPFEDRLLDAEDGFAEFDRVWGTGSGLPHQGEIYFYSSAPGSTATFNFVFPNAGEYEVFFYFAASDNRSPDTPVKVVHALGSTTLVVNQKINGNSQFSLGRYYFTPGFLAQVEVTVANGGGFASVDAIQFVLSSLVSETASITASPSRPSSPSTSRSRTSSRSATASRSPSQAPSGIPTPVPDPGRQVTELILDSEDSGSVTLVGPWSSYSSITPFEGTNYLVTAAVSGRAVIFNLPITEISTFEVFFQFAGHPNRASNVPVLITSYDGKVAVVSTVTIDQRGDGTFRSLGVFTFTQGAARIEVRTNGVNGFVSVDAIKLAAPTIVLDAESGSGVQIIGSGWSTASGLTPLIGTNYIWTSAGSRSVRFTPNIPAWGVYELFVFYSSHPNRSPTVAVQINASGQTSSVNINQQIGGFEWKSLGFFTFPAGTGSTVQIFSPGNGVTTVDAIMIG